MNKLNVGEYYTFECVSVEEAIEKDVNICCIYRHNYERDLADKTFTKEFRLEDGEEYFSIKGWLLPPTYVKNIREALMSEVGTEIHNEVLRG